MRNETFFSDSNLIINNIDKRINVLLFVEIFLSQTFEIFSRYDHRSNKWFTLNKHPFITLSRLYGIFFG